MRREESAIATNLYFTPAQDRQKARLELTDYQMDRMRIRLVADGTNFWFYDHARNEYAMTDYKDEKDLLTLARSLCNGNSLYAIRTLSEITLGSPFKSWLSVSRITTAVDRPDVAVMKSATSKLEIECSWTEDREVYVNNLFYTEAEGDFYSEWRIRVRDGFASAGNTFKFTIPKGAKPVSFPTSKRVGS